MVAVDILRNLRQLHLHCPAMVNEYHARIEPITLARLSDIIRKLQAHHFVDGVLDAHHVPVVTGKAGFKPNVLAKTKGDVIFNARARASRPIVHHVNGITTKQQFDVLDHVRFPRCLFVTQPKFQRVHNFKPN